MKISKTLTEFTEQVKEQLSNTKYCLTAQTMTVDLAKDCFEVANAMLNNFRAIKEEGGFNRDEPRLVDELEKSLVFWTDSAKELWDGISGFSLVCRNWGL